MNLVQSSNQRKAYEAEMQNKARDFRIDTKVFLASMCDMQTAQKTWNEIKAISFPEITFYRSAIEIIIKDEKSKEPFSHKLDKDTIFTIAAFLKDYSE